MTANAFALSFPAARCLIISTLGSLSANARQTEEDRQAMQAAALEALAELTPSNAAEAMLAAQVVSTHHAAMDCYQKAAAPDLSNAMVVRILGRALALSRMSLRMMGMLEKSRKQTLVARQGSLEAMQPATPAPQAVDPCPEPLVNPVLPEMPLIPRGVSAACVPAPVAAPFAIAVESAGSAVRANHWPQPAAKRGNRARDALMVSTVIPDAAQVAV
jgi:hypothetical protein